MARLRQKIQRGLNPIKEAEDPYIVAVLIALAQQYRRKHRKAARDSPVPAASQDKEAAPKVAPKATTRTTVCG